MNSTQDVFWIAFAIKFGGSLLFSKIYRPNNKIWPINNLANSISGENKTIQ